MYIPSYEELEHREIPFSGNILRAGSLHLGKYCENKNDEFMLCRSELGPTRCINEGKEVTDCTMEFFGKLKKLCYHELDRFSNCLDKGSSDLRLRPCRKTQEAFDQCVLDNMGIQRPKIGYYTRVRIYDSARPAPVEKPQIFADTPISPDSPDFPPPTMGKYVFRDFDKR